MMSFCGLTFTTNTLTVNIESKGCINTYVYTHVIDALKALDYLKYFTH